MNATAPAALAEFSQLQVEHYRELKGTLPGAGAPWLEEIRDRAVDGFAGSGFPTTRREAWRYTNLAPLAGIDFGWRELPAEIDPESLPALVFGRESTFRLTFVNGGFRADLSRVEGLPNGVRLLNFAEALAEMPDRMERWIGASLVEEDLGDEQPLAALNLALAGDGFILHLEPDAAPQMPIEILWVGAGAERPPAYHPRNLIVAEAGSRATVVEHHVGLCIGSYFSNVVTEILAEDGAIVRHCKIQNESQEAFHTALTAARIGRDAMVDSFVFSVGGRLSRNEIRVSLDAPGAHCRLNGAYLMKGEQHCDNTTVIDHLAPHTASSELYKGVLDDRARGVFQGRITVHQGAQKADGHQMNRALLLSERAEFDSKPELEIFADDVKCSHGATAGELDEAALFYLRSRGVPEAQARRLLVEAFLAEVLDGVALAGMLQPLEQTIIRWMRSRGA